ncbi:ABC transporter permease [Bradyrhizobium sp. NP1]|uniref:ABC transporter permease n=1 Tax=Bradyrhizobium sp. NP1 TaxID=3049772 RepID=UPI0025A53D3C|nr:ABC transporter permease [Bradyrhizobium sp. NP1]WJR75821.1 ABC transporter permease [Bradyrhizobium sp. NP1]
MALPTLLGVMVVVFVLIRVVPGDPISMMISGEASPEDIAKLREAYGLDRSIPVQFLYFLKSVSTGNLGTSISLHQDVLELIMGRLPATLELAILALFIATVLGVSFALIAVYWRSRWPEVAVDTANALALALPEFLWALLLILLLSVSIPLFPISGRTDPSNAAVFHTQFYLFESLFTGRFSELSEVLRHMFLPAVSLALPLTAVIGRVLKSSLLDAINQDYVLLARAKGFSPLYVLLRHALPNALIPAITITGTQFTLLIGGTVLIELIFAYPGIGNMLFGAAINRDLPLMQGITIIFAVVFILVNICIDMSYGLINPRVRLD